MLKKVPMRLWWLLWLAPALSAQGGDPWSALRSPAVSLRLRNPHVYRQGELIAAEVRPPLIVVSPPGKPPGEQWQFAGILLDPSGECGTVSKPCVPKEMIPMVGLRAVSDHEDVALNSYLPPLAPGRYRVAALARALVLGVCAPGSTCYRLADPPRYAVSDTVEFEIAAASADWVRQAIARSEAVLTGPEPRDSAGYQAQKDAAEQLTLFDDPAAWSASLAVLPKMESVLLPGLERAPAPAKVCDLMQARVTAPEQSVSGSYLNALAYVCARAHLPPAPVIHRGAPATAVISAKRPEASLPVQPPEPAMTAWIEKQHAYTEDVLAKASAALAGSVTGKQPEAKWEAMATLLQRVQQVRVNRPREADPSWLPAVAGEFARDFASVPVARKQYLLDLYGATVNSPDAAAFLESVLDDWRPGEYYEAPHSALQALFRIDPARARARIRAELMKDKTWLDEASLAMLPPADVPPMDDALIGALARAQQPGGWNARLTMAAIALYATPKALPRIRAIYESQRDPCQPELAAYFVRVDPGYADGIFHSHPWDMHAAPPRCTVQYFERTPPLAMGAGLEQYLGAYLMHQDTFVKSTAARMLARYGTAASLPRLWDAFRYFHDYWKGKPAELAQDGGSWRLESDLRDAIARGRGWLVSEADLRLVESLCISGKCIGDTREDIEAMKEPVEIEILLQPGGMANRVGQYYGLESVAAVESKMGQFPKGTRFALRTQGGGEDGTETEILRFAAGRGFLVTMR